MSSLPAGQAYWSCSMSKMKSERLKVPSACIPLSHIERLKGVLGENRAAIGQRKKFIETDVSFHLTIASFTRNPVFIALHDAMSTWLRQQREISLDVPDQEKIAYAAHERIFEAIAARDADRAEVAMSEHIVQLTASYWDALEGKSSPS